MADKFDWLSLARKHGYAFPDLRMQGFIADLLEVTAPQPAVGVTLSDANVKTWQEEIMADVLEAAREWSLYVVEDTAPVTLSEYLERALLASQQKGG